MSDQKTVSSEEIDKDSITDNEKVKLVKWKKNLKCEVVPISFYTDEISLRTLQIISCRQCKGCQRRAEWTKKCVINKLKNQL